MNEIVDKNFKHKDNVQNRTEQNRTEQNRTERLFSIDFIKGLLIIFVFTGHIIPGELRHTFLRYIIYSFHMPLFIGISGFLVDYQNKNFSFKTILSKFWNRLIKPWVIAITVYFIINSFNQSHHLNIILFIKCFLKPFYHLWYIPAYISYFIIIWFLWKSFRKTNYTWIMLFSVSAIISIISKWDLLEDLINTKYYKSIYELLKYDLRLYNLIFFTAGAYLRFKVSTNNKIFHSDYLLIVCRTILLISLLTVSIIFFFDYNNIEKIMFYVMNLLLMIIILNDCISNIIPRNKILEFIGKYSLPIYLYHVISQQVASCLFVPSSIGYYSTCIFAFTIIVLLVWLLRKNKIVNTYIFGSTNSCFDVK